MKFFANLVLSVTLIVPAAFAAPSAAESCKLGRVIQFNDSATIEKALLTIPSIMPRLNAIAFAKGTTPHVQSLAVEVGQTWDTESTWGHAFKIKAQYTLGKNRTVKTLVFTTTEGACPLMKLDNQGE